MTEIDYAMLYGFLDPNKNVKFTKLIEIFQDVSEIDAAKFCVSVPQLLEHGLTWMLRRYRVTVHRLPSGADKGFRVKTFATPVRNLYSRRKFELWCGEELLVEAYAWYVLIDFAAAKPIRFDRCEILKNNMNMFCTDTNEVPEPRVQSLNEPMVSKDYEVRWQELDLNRHTNHSVFFTWALETVPKDIENHMSPHIVEVEFLHQIPFGLVTVETEELQGQSSGRQFLHSIKTGGREAGRVYSFWEELKD